MAYKSLILERDGPIAVVTLNRPDASNAFDFTLMVELDDAMRVVGADPDVGAVILTGAGRHFSTGIDLSVFTNPEALVAKEGGSPEITPEKDDETYGKGTPVGVVVRMRRMSKPVIAAINGNVAGAALSVALACDMRVASDKARFSMAFIKRGLVPDSGGSFTLPHVVGFPRACELILTGDAIDAAEAYRIGLVNRVVPHDELMTVAKELAGKITKNPPLAVAKAKADLYNAMTVTDIIEQMKREEASQGRLLNTEDFMEAATAFLEKREPRFKGR